MTVNDSKYLTSTCWNERHQPLTIDMTKDKNTGRYRLGLSLYLCQIAILLKINYK